MRQSDPSQAEFRSLLKRVRNGTINEQDVTMLCSREAKNLSVEEREVLLRDGIFCFGERKLVDHCNE